LLLDFGFFGLVIFAVWAGLRSSGLAGRDCAAMEGEYDLAGGSFAAIPNHEDVIAGAAEQLIDDVPRRSGPVVAKDALIGAESLDFDARGGGDLVENFLQA